MVRCPRDFRAICTAVAPDAVGTLRIYNPTPPVYDGHLVPCSSDHNRAIMPNCELQPRELLKNVPTRVVGCGYDYFAGRAARKDRSPEPTVSRCPCQRPFRIAPVKPGHR